MGLFLLTICTQWKLNKRVIRMLGKISLKGQKFLVKYDLWRRCLSNDWLWAQHIYSCQQVWCIDWSLFWSWHLMILFQEKVWPTQCTYLFVQSSLKRSYVYITCTSYLAFTQVLMSAYDQIFHGNFYYWQQSFEKKIDLPILTFMIITIFKPLWSWPLMRKWPGWLPRVNTGFFW